MQSKIKQETLLKIGLEIENGGNDQIQVSCIGICLLQEACIQHTTLAGSNPQGASQQGMHCSAPRQPYSLQTHAQSAEFGKESSNMSPSDALRVSCVLFFAAHAAACVLQNCFVGCPWLVTEQ